jgi:hypothetical protein
MSNQIDIKELARELAPYLSPPKVKEPEPVADENDLPDGTALVDGEIIYTDPVAKICDETEARALESLPMGQGIYRGKNGTQLINHSKESLDTTRSFRRDRMQFGSRSRI